MSDAIDFVIPWVDGADPEWLAEKTQFDFSADNRGSQGDTRARYEDWGLLPYWFRAVEKFAPWVRNVHFVTWGHIPSWLNTGHRKLHVVRHSDYMPAEYVPTFSANPIELNLHRIEGLAEQFVYFNDDMLLLRAAKPEDFFKDGLPCATAGLVPFRVVKGDWLYFPVNNVAILNANFEFRKSIKKNLGKWLNPQYGLGNFITALMLPFPAFYGFNEYHLPSSFLKSTFEEVWDKEKEILDATSRHKFREHSDVNQWLMENWQFAKGSFTPRSPKFGRAFYLSGDEALLQAAVSYIEHQKGIVTCVNDGPMTPGQAHHAQGEIRAAFEKILPEKSSFEI